MKRELRAFDMFLKDKGIHKEYYKEFNSKRSKEWREFNDNPGLMNPKYFIGDAFSWADSRTLDATQWWRFSILWRWHLDRQRKSKYFKIKLSKNITIL